MHRMDSENADNALVPDAHAVTHAPTLVSASNAENAHDDPNNKVPVDCHGGVTRGGRRWCRPPRVHWSPPEDVAKSKAMEP